MTPEASGGEPPFGQDFNGLLYMITGNVAALAAGAFPAYSAARSTAIGGYPAGAVLANASGNGYWINASGAANTTNPDSLGTGWLPLATTGRTDITLASSNVTLTAAQGAAPVLNFNGTLGANITVILPTWEGAQWVVANTTTGSFTLTVGTVAGTGVVVPATGFAAPTSVYCDGLNIQNTGVSTAGLAPLASPTFTGNPAAPTPLTSSNSTSIATTAFTKAAIAAALNGYAVLASPTFTGNPTAPTQPGGTNNATLATTAFVQSAIGSAAVAQKSGTFTCNNGQVSVAFGVTFPSIPRVFVQWNYASPDVGWIVPGSITTTGFKYQSGNSGTCLWFATTA